MASGDSTSCLAAWTESPQNALLSTMKAEDADLKQPIRTGLVDGGGVGMCFGDGRRDADPVVVFIG